MTRIERQTIPIKEVYAGMFDGPHATPKPSDSGPIFLGIKNVGASGQLDLSDVRHISEEEYPRWIKRVEPRSGDIVFSYEATLNRYAMIPKGFRGCLGRRMALVRPDESKACGRFLYYSFFGQEWRNVIAQETLIGSTVDRIPITKFPDFPITVPPLLTQQKIAAILSAYDDLIENNLRRIKILEEMAQNLYREWFVKFRFPGHQRTRFTDSPLGPIPEGWEVTTLGDLVTIDKGISYKGEFLTDDGIPMVNLKCIIPGGGFNRKGTKPYAGEYKSRHRVVSGDLVFANTDLTQAGNIIGSPGLVPRCGFDQGGLASHHICLVRVSKHSPVSRIFLFHLLQSGGFREHAKGCASGTTVLGFRSDDALVFKFALPTQQLTKRFEQMAIDLYELSESLDDRNTSLRRTRDLLLPRLISGELDVSELDIAVPKEIT